MASDHAKRTGTRVAETGVMSAIGTCAGAKAMTRRGTTVGVTAVMVTVEGARGAMMACAGLTRATWRLGMGYATHATQDSAPPVLTRGWAVAGRRQGTSCPALGTGRGGQ